MKNLIKSFIILSLFLIMSITIIACDGNSQDIIPVENVSIVGADSVTKNIPQQYTAIITPNNATNKAVTWEIESGTAEINDSGVLLAEDIGTVVIKATVGAKSAIKQIEVNNTTESEKTTDPLKITFNGFDKIDDTTYTIKVSNNTEYLNIGNLATINYEWKLTLDIQGKDEIPSKVATPLNEGDNTFYVLVFYNNDVRLYILKIRRKPIYEVVFNTNGGNYIEPQYVEEESFISSPTEPTKIGYEFVSWDKDIATPIVQNTSFVANWRVVMYDITYILDNAATTNNPLTYSIETETIILQDAEMNGYIFIGWYIDSEYTNKIEIIPKGSYGNLLIYAKFKLPPKELSAPTIEWDDISNTITVINTDVNADNVVVTVNGMRRTMSQDKNIFTLNITGEHVGQLINVTAYATSINSENFSRSTITNYISPYINRNFTMIKNPSLSWGASSGIFMFYLYKDVVNYTIYYDGIIIMEDNSFVNNRDVGILNSIPGVVSSRLDFDRYGYTFTPFLPEVGKTLTITFTLKNNVNVNAIQQYYFESEFVSCTITDN